MHNAMKYIEAEIPNYIEMMGGFPIDLHDDDELRKFSCELASAFIYL